MAVWLAGGIALAALLLSPRRLWPALGAVFFLAGNAANLAVGRPLLESAGLMTASVAESLGCAWLILRVCGDGITFRRLREVLALIAAAVFANAATSVIGAGTAWFVRAAPFWDSWTAWYIADGLGILLVAPFIVSWAGRQDAVAALRGARLAEACAFFVLWCALAWLTFNASFGFILYTPPPYLLVAILAWPALRFGPRGTTLALVLLTVITIGSAAETAGSLVWGSETLTGRLLLAQLYLAVITVVGLLLAASHAEGQSSDQSARESDAKYRELVESSNSIILRWDITGKITFFNEYGSRFFGFTREELVGRNVLETIVPATDSSGRDLADMVRDIAAHPERYETNENENLRRDGSRVWVAWTNRPSLDDRGRCVEILAVGNDITERKRTESVLSARLRLMQLAESCSLPELLRATLDEAEALTGSHAGFYHFVEADQVTLSLQAWSTNTTKRLCTAAGANLHYALNEAGVWADCIRERRPTIHNDYASLPRRKGLPEGHAPVIRELVVPVRRGNSFVAVLGVGNKQADYTEKDVDTVASLADFAWDIAVHKRAEQALGLAHERLRRFVDANVVGVVIATPTGEFVEANDYYLNLLGFTRAEFDAGKLNWRAVTPPEWLPADEKCIGELRERGSCAPYEKEYVRRDGVRVPVLLADALLPGPEEQIAAFVLDLTERNQAQTQLRYQATLLDTIADAVLATDRQFNIQYWNPAAERQYGWTSAEVAGRHFKKFIRPQYPGEPRRSIMRTIAARGFWTGELLHNRRDGTCFPVQVTLSEVRDMEGRVVGHVTINRDITQNKQAEEEKGRLETQLRQAQKMESVGQLAGGVAHDFNNMLAVILGYTEVALEQVDSSQPLHADLREIQKAATHSADLTRQLLAFARRQTAAPKVLDLNETLARMLKMLQRLIGEDVQLHWHPGSGLWPVRIDPSQIDQILANLCVNARDAIADVGAVTIETANCTVDDHDCGGSEDIEPGEYVTLTVSDNGCGMDQGALGHIFEPFFTTKEVGKGTGMGLATIYGIVKQNRGFIDVHSEVGRGTAFRIHLPRHACATGQPRAEGAPEPLPRGRETILLVEDEPALLKIAATTLRSLGYTVLPAGTPGEALRLAGEHGGKIGLLMTDVVMPEMSGRDLAASLLSLCPQVQRLFMSGYTADAIAHHGMLDDGVHFIQKPFSINDLAAKVREVLEHGDGVAGDAG